MHSGSAAETASSGYAVIGAPRAHVKNTIFYIFFCFYLFWGFLLFFLRLLGFLGWFLGGLGLYYYYCYYYCYYCYCYYCYCYYHWPLNSCQASSGPVEARTVIKDL